MASRSLLGEVSELADERDLGSRGEIRESSNLSFPILAMRKWLSGRASPCQGEGREFESRLPLCERSLVVKQVCELAFGRYPRASLFVVSSGRFQSGSKRVV